MEESRDINLRGFLKMLENPEDEIFWYYCEEFDSLCLLKDGSLICAGLKGGLQKKYYLQMIYFIDKIAKYI